MLGKIPIASLDELGQINNINLLLLNNIFAKLYLNDVYYKNLYDRIPKIYQNKKIYNENDCVWLNTEYYREFIDFPLHAKHIVDDYNSSEHGSIESNLSLQYDDVELKIMILSVASDNTISSSYLNYEDKTACLSLIHYSYIIGDLTDGTGAINNSILYKCNFNNVSAWTNVNNEYLPLKDRLSVDAKTNISTIVTYNQYKDILNYEKYTYPVWSVLYNNTSEINYGWISAYVRSILSVHAMTISVSYEDGSPKYNNVIPSTNALGRMPAFPGDTTTLLVSAYTPGYETNGYSIYPINDTLLSIAIQKIEDIPISATTNVGYFYKDLSANTFNKGLITNNDLSTDNVYFQHNVLSTESQEEIDNVYAAIDTFNIHLSSIWTCFDKEKLHVNFNYDLSTHLSSTFDCVICSSGEFKNSDTNINVWASGLVEAYGNNNNYYSLLKNGVILNDFGIKIKFSMENAITMSSLTNNSITYYVLEQQLLSNLIPILSGSVPSIKNYVLQIING